MMVVSAPFFALLVAKLQMLCNPGSYYTFEGRLTTMLGTAVSDAITILIVCLLRYWYDSYALKNKENERLRIENLNTRLDALKKQLGPHFLFNSLNTLRGLISPENVEARQYVDGMALRIVFDCSERYGYMRILPMSVQLLVENAVKHNVLSPDVPLEVRVYTTEDARVVVCNRINPRDNGSVESAGTGLSNLFERYRLRFGASVDIDTSDGFFTVSVNRQPRQIRRLQGLAHYARGVAAGCRMSAMTFSAGSLNGMQRSLFSGMGWGNSRLRRTRVDWGLAYVILSKG